MKACLDCIPCFVRQSLEAARFATDDAAIQEQVLREVLGEVATLDLQQSPPATAQWIHRRLRELSGKSDPYAEVKRRSNELALAMLPELRRLVAESPKPLEAAVRLAIGGNIIDAGVHGSLCSDRIRETLDRARSVPLHGSSTQLAEAIHDARHIVYLADNAGEIVLDQLLVEQLPRDRVTLVVRGGPVLNDATMDDAMTTGMCELVTVIDNGSDAPGTLVEQCSDAFRSAFNEADLVISKGQGNYESLHYTQHDNIYYLLMAKCSLVARHIGCAEGSFVICSSRDLSERTNSAG